MVTLTPAIQKFVLHWGEMGDRWGVNRSVAQIYALLYIAKQPMTAEQVAETLSMARSNVSTSIRELLDWNIIKVEQRMGDRCDYYHALEDPWETFERMLDKRRQREIEPTLRVLSECIAMAEKDPKEDRHAAARLTQLREFMHEGDTIYALMRTLPRAALLGLLRTGTKLREAVTGRSS